MISSKHGIFLWVWFANLIAPVVTLGTVEISEFMAKNESTLATAAGTYADWVEIHNASGGAVDLTGWYLTDDITDLRKWQFPSTPATSPLADGGYLVVFVDDSPDAVIGNELHAGFKLGSGGEYLALVEPDGETVVYQYNPEYPDQSADISYGIDTGTGEHAYFANPTPGTANGQAIADTVLFSQKSGTFTSPFSLVLSVASPTAEIRYTLDGSMPSESSTLYDSGIVLSGTTRVRAQAFDAGLVDGAVVSETYYHLEADAAAFSSDLPLVVIDSFGAGEIPHPDSETRQVSQVMIFEPVDGLTQLTNSPSIASRAGIRRRGESSLRNTATKPNISLETWGEVDEDSKSIKPFGMPAESDWILFAPWSFDRALMRNSFIYEVSNESGNYAVRTQFVEVFLNIDGGSLSASDYYGVYVFMEKIKIDSDRVDIAKLEETVDSEPDLSGGYLWKLDKADNLGDVDNFAAAGKTLPTSLGQRVLQYVSPAGDEMTEIQRNWLPDHINAIDAAIPNGNYESMIDVNSFADHHIMNVFANNADGLSASTFYHKDRNGLVKMGPIWDFDRSMGCDNDARAVNPEIWSLATDANFFFRSSGPLWFRALAEDESDFWMVWADRWQLMREGPLSEAVMNERINRYQAELANAAIRNFDRWGNIPSSEWSTKVQVFRNHVQARANWIDEQLIDPPTFSQEGGLVSSGFQLTMTGPETKYYTVDGSDPRASGGSAAGSTYSSPITITENTRVKARGGNGAAFKWAPGVWPWSPLSEAMFVVDPAPLAITEIMYHPRPPSTPSELVYTASDFEFIEIQNTSASSCLLVGVQLVNGVEFDLTDAASASLGAGEYGVLVRNPDAFKVRYSNWASLNILGTYTGRLSDSGEKMKLGYNLTNMTALASFDYEDDWFPCTDGEGFSLVLNDSQSDPASWDSKAAWRHSSGVDGSPGAMDPSLTYAPGTIVVNEVLTHQDVDDPGDWIELYNTTASAVNIGGWFLSDSRGDLKKYLIPAGTTVPAHGYLVLTEHDHFGSDIAPTPFALSEHGDSVYLSAGSGGELSEPAYRESQDFKGQERDVTFGRYIRTDGSAVFPTMNAATPGAANSAPRIGPVVMEEIMYHPAVGGYEYIKIRNTSGSPVALYDVDHPSHVWTVTGIDFKFPVGTTLDAGDSLLLVRDVISAALFRTLYQVPASIQIFSYTGALDNDAESLVLKKPGSPEVQTGYVPNIVVEQVKYNDSAPWPVEADGIGKSLKRINLSSYANDVANWQADAAGYGPLLYLLTVHSGSGEGEYAAGTLVPIVAVTTNLSFVQWIGNVAGVTDVQSTLTSLTMPAQDSTISALYSGPASPVTFFNAGADWKYHDQGHDLGTAWRSPEFDDSGWISGAAQLGYGDEDETTVVSFGGDSGNKYITTYFRKTFEVEDASLVYSLSLELLRDDGAVVYLNGVEVLRDRMGTGTIYYNTLSPEYPIGGADEDIFNSFVLDPGALVDGTNVMAVEIHQESLDSSDISFDASLAGEKLPVDLSVQDGDADGMYDAWETVHFGSTEGALSGDDPDEDGCVNSNEFIAGTLPDDAESCFLIEQFDGSEISWTTVPGRTYSVYWTDDLQIPFVLVASDADGSYTDPQSAANPASYYRIKVELD